ncbi:hypothetical protein BX616_010184 [Lobosporangium transversale]|uniref:Dienelactone hydrolase domain-containing protein n=1 Tax=Lobosporangium transversale TaxID=64571 RepID=A0A1Y2GSA6_9FUNG|nr:hypothetical protein BCR41DRAFT_304247 [Lobosporangium transversale]KAF9913069.1 hypothetical protein BX616_010184 [Lobosporangium transversale]ORZ19240.1 hypothetical protein BCR41DRAFT_304247 [Lobosporangium transversale]|eukprot:XP_021882408.1 hypothetical protein BCR41DRAFT_304247 [Lobosporangium transversale]
MSLSDSCCNTPPTNAEWERKGHDKVLLTKVHGEEQKVYRTGPKDSKYGIIAVYDILGFHPTTYQFYDRLATANGGFQVSAPYFFKKILPESYIGNRPLAIAWIDDNANYKKNHYDDLIRAAVEDLRSDGCTTFSIFGQCWGTYISILAASEDDSPFLAAGGPHPAMCTVELVKNIKCPVILLPAKDDDDMVGIPLVEEVNRKNFSTRSVHKRFTEVHHGWTGSRGDWSDPVQFRAGMEAVNMLAEFFVKVAENPEDK